MIAVCFYVVAYSGLLLAVYLLVDTMIIHRFLQYSISANGIGVKIFGLVPLWQVRLEDIEEIRKVRLRDFAPAIGAWRMGNRFWMSAPVLVRSRRRRIIRSVLLTPAKPDEFVAECGRRLGSGRTGG